eukprot:1161895-Pelagomonas_calceolata.AAC.3
MRPFLDARGIMTCYSFSLLVSLERKTTQAEKTVVTSLLAYITGWAWSLLASLMARWWSSSRALIKGMLRVSGPTNTQKDAHISTPVDLATMPGIINASVQEQNRSIMACLQEQTHTILLYIQDQVAKVGQLATWLSQIPSAVLSSSNSYLL